MLFAGDRQVEDMTSEGVTLVGAPPMPTLVGLGATPAELEAALALLTKVAAKLAEHHNATVKVSNVDDLTYYGGNINMVELPGAAFVAVNAALALAQRVPLAQSGNGALGTGAQVAQRLQEGIAALMPLVETARAGAAPSSSRMSTGAKVAIGVGLAAVLGLSAWAVARHR